MMRLDGAKLLNIIALRLDASFEILMSLSNPNRIQVALD
jgi:hypothetical protein